MHKRVGRAALTILLLLATQLAFAGQVCGAVTMGSVADGHPAQLLAEGGEVTVASPDALPCCEDVAAPASRCFTAFGDMHVVALAAGGSPLLDLASPIRDRSTLAVVAAYSVSVALPTTSVGPPLPAYILLRRFLS